VGEFDFLASLPSVMPELGLMFLALIVLASDVGFFGISSLPEDRKYLIPYIAAFGMAFLAITPLAFAPDRSELLGRHGAPRHTLTDIQGNGAAGRCNYVPYRRRHE